MTPRTLQNEAAAIITAGSLASTPHADIAARILAMVRERQVAAGLRGIRPWWKKQPLLGLVYGELSAPELREVGR